MSDMILTTTPYIEGRKVQDYLGIRDFFASIRDIVGGRAASYEEVLREAKDRALQELEEKARAMGANAVIGIDLDYETVGERGSMLMVTASGTAVRVEG